MKFLNTFKQRDGSYQTTEWKANEVFNLGFVKCIIIGVALGFISIIASAICLVARLWDYEENEKQSSFIGIITALYFICDYWRGWFVTWLIDICGYSYNLGNMVCLNVALLVTHILLLIFGDTFFYGLEDDAETDKNYYLGIMCVISMVVTFLITKIFI